MRRPRANRRTFQRIYHKLVGEPWATLLFSSEFVKIWATEGAIELKLLGLAVASAILWVASDNFANAAKEKVEDAVEE